MARDMTSRINTALNFHGISLSNYDLSRPVSGPEFAAHNACCDLIRNFVNGELVMDDHDDDVELDGDEDDDDIDDAGFAVGIKISNDLVRRGIYTDHSSKIGVTTAAPPPDAAIRYVVDIYNGHGDDDE